MTEEYQRLYESIDGNDARSKLESYREVILRWKRDSRPFRAIQRALSKNGVSVALGTLHEFVQRRSRPRKSVAPPIHHNPAACSDRPQARRSPEEVAAMREAARAANHKPTVKPKEPPIFEYDPTKPLTNRPS